VVKNRRMTCGVELTNACLRYQQQQKDDKALKTFAAGVITQPYDPVVFGAQDQYLRYSPGKSQLAQVRVRRECGKEPKDDL
jgi:hypothetical protein